MKRPMLVTAAERAAVLAARRDGRQLVALTDDEAGVIDDARARGLVVAAVRLSDRQMLALDRALRRRRELTAARHATHMAHVDRALYGEPSE